MADGEKCMDGDSVSCCREECGVKRSMDFSGVLQKEIRNTERLNAVKSAPLISDISDNLLLNLRVNGSKKVRVVANMLGDSVDCLCSPAEDSYRKKRCQDRYDSSESSDSGVAALGCTDCSASSSSVSSDITDLSSPYSPASIHSTTSDGSDDSGNSPAKPSEASSSWPPWLSGEDRRPRTSAWKLTKSLSPPSDADVMPPNVPSTRETVWPWAIKDSSVEIEKAEGPPPPPPPLTTITASVDEYPPKSLKRQISTATPKKPGTVTLSSSKRAKVEQTPAKPLPKNSTFRTPQRFCVQKKVFGIDSKTLQSESKSQGKITEYFRTQVKPSNGIKKELTVLVTKTIPDIKSPTLLTRKFVADLKNAECKLEKLIPSLGSLKNVTAVDTKKDSASKTTKTTTKLLDKKSGLSNSSRKVFSSSEKLSGSKRNVVSPQSTESQKLDSLSSPPSPPVASLTGTTGTLPLADSPSIPKSSTSLLDVSPKSSSKDVSTESVSEQTCKPKPEEDSAGGTLSESNISDVSASPNQFLSVNIPVSTSTPSLSSPILSAPRTIRFPATQRMNSGSSLIEKDGSTVESLDSTSCKWSECTSYFESNTCLLEHLQAKHVNSQVMGENFVCLWVGCKVYGRTSCSRSWLERHVLSHGGNKLFRCIVDDCDQRFSSQTGLERHVNGHFSQSQNGTNGTGNKKNVENSACKLFRRNGKKLRLRRHPWSARMFDYFDCGIMESLEHRLIKMTEKRTLCNVESAPPDTITLRSTIVAKRTEKDGTKRFLLRWNPPDILQDEWVLESEVTAKRDVPLKSIPHSSYDATYTALFDVDGVKSSKPTASPRKNRRKQGPL